ncbi:hypothetical protein Misp06_00789 [Microbulbifer sp. NBRC 101763]|uniref:hypothetical protein n=1 Tax=Microbulbifer sp. NBRC 101763 TaxID=1113820 RepID=UPI0030A8B026
MNKALKQLVSSLLEEDFNKAREQSRIFPNRYGSKILDKQGNLTEFGLWEAVDFPFPRKLSTWLCKFIEREDSMDALPHQFGNYVNVFRLVKKADKELSEFAQIKAIQSMNIDQQCKSLGINFEKLEGVKTSQKVELFVSDHYSKRGFQSINLEGGEILVLIRCASWESLSKIFSMHDTPYLEALLVDHEDPTKINKKAVSLLLKGIGRSNRKSVVRSFKTIYPNTLLEKVYPGLTSSFVGDLYEVIGQQRLLELARCFAGNPYQYRKGWPDVTAFKLKRRLIGKSEASLLLREVKVKDKLLPSQIITLRKFKKLIPDIGIIRVAR